MIFGCLIICFLVTIAYQLKAHREPIIPENILRSVVVLKEQLQDINQRHSNTVTYERRTTCNYEYNETCYSTNKSLVVTFWSNNSTNKWLSQNILSAFPMHSFDHMIFVHDNSSWHSHPGYQHFMWIYVIGQHRLWYLKRFVLPKIVESYAFIWIIDDDAKLNFNPLYYQCIVRNLNVSLSAPGRLTGAISHYITKVHAHTAKNIGRWTDFVETGPIVVISSLVWQCIYTIIDASTGTGWGIDFVWCKMLADHCSVSKSDGKKVCAILDAFTVDHESANVKSWKDGSAEFAIYTAAYKKWLTQHQILGPLAKDNSLITFCSR